MANVDVRLALIRNAKTPPVFSLWILPTLPDSEVRSIARAGTNMALQQAAFANSRTKVETGTTSEPEAAQSRINMMIDEELKSVLDAMRQENAAAYADTRRHFDVGNEATRHEIRFVAETVAQVNEKLERAATALDEEIERTAGETQARSSSRTMNCTAAFAHSRRLSAPSNKPSPTFRRA